MPRTFIPVKAAEDRTGFIPLKSITYIDPGPKDGSGYPYARTKDGTRYTLHKDWRDPASHLHLRKLT